MSVVDGRSGLKPAVFVSLFCSTLASPERPPYRRRGVIFSSANGLYAHELHAQLLSDHADLSGLAPLATVAGTLAGGTIGAFETASTDATAAVARKSRTDVISVPERGTGNVVRQTFADGEADSYGRW